MLASIKQALESERFVLRTARGVAKSADVSEAVAFEELQAGVVAGDVVTTGEGTTREPLFGLKSRLVEKVLAALADERYTARTLRGVARQAGGISLAVAESVMRSLADELPPRVAISTDGQWFALPERVAPPELRLLGAGEDDLPMPGEGGTFDPLTN